MSAAKTLWLVNAVLFFLACVLARDILGARIRRVRRERRRLLEITRDMLDARPNSDELRAAWAVIIREATPKTSSGELISDAVCLLEGASDAGTDSLRRIIEPHVNVLNDVAAYIDEGLVRPKDIVKYFPELHATLLNDLALIVPFIWFQSILRGEADGGIG
jgi:hypothetical protein